MTHENFLYRAGVDTAIRDCHFLEFAAIDPHDSARLLLPRCLFARSFETDGDTLHVVSSTGAHLTYYGVPHVDVRPCMRSERERGRE